MEKIISEIKEAMKKQCVTTPKLLERIGITEEKEIRKTNRLISGDTKRLDMPYVKLLQQALGIAESEAIYAVSKVIEGISSEEAEALRIMRECPEALSVVRMMGAVDNDTQKDIQRIAETEKRTFEKLRQLQELKRA